MTELTDTRVVILKMGSSKMLTCRYHPEERAVAIVEDGAVCAKCFERAKILSGEILFTAEYDDVGIPTEVLA